MPSGRAETSMFNSRADRTALVWLSANFGTIATDPAPRAITASRNEVRISVWPRLAAQPRAAVTVVPHQADARRRSSAAAAVGRSLRGEWPSNAVGPIKRVSNADLKEDQEHTEHAAHSHRRVPTSKPQPFPSQYENIRECRSSEHKHDQRGSPERRSDQGTSRGGPERHDEDHLDEGKHDHD